MTINSLCTYSVVEQMSEQGYRPTINSSNVVARGRNIGHMSIVNIVLLLLKIDVSDDMSADNITAIMSPRSPDIS